MSPDRDKTGWSLGLASVTGTSHLETGLPCQDFAACRTSGDQLVAVVCDGAGSADRADIGARISAETVADRLIDAEWTLDPDHPERIHDPIHQAIAQAREKITDQLEPDETLADYHTTLVGIVADEGGACFFHIGDGFGLAALPELCRDDEQANGSVHYWERLAFSRPENGWFANETYFLTQDRWENHLRFKHLVQPPELVVLASDGPEPFIVQDGKPNQAFIDVVILQCQRLDSDKARHAYVEQILSSPKADPVTSDDKTLLVAMREKWTRTPLSELQPQQGEPRETLASDEADSGERPFRTEIPEDEATESEVDDHAKGAPVDDDNGQ